MSVPPRRDDQPLLMSKNLEADKEGGEAFVKRKSVQSVEKGCSQVGNPTSGEGDEKMRRETNIPKWKHRMNEENGLGDWVQR